MIVTQLVQQPSCNTLCILLLCTLPHVLMSSVLHLYYMVYVHNVEVVL